MILEAAGVEPGHHSSPKTKRRSVILSGESIGVAMPDVSCVLYRWATSPRLNLRKNPYFNTYGGKAF
jgi:hypothetical protein